MRNRDRGRSPAASSSFIPHPLPRRSLGEGGSSFRLPPSSLRSRPRHALASCEGGFTLIELLVVMGIISILIVLVAPAITSLKSADDITSSAYTVKGILEQARTYAKTNTTYTWVGFYEEDGSQASTNPATPGVGRLILSIVGSKNGSQGFRPNSAVSGTNFFDVTKVAQVGKLVKVDNVHLPLFAGGSGTGDTFDTRPAPDSNTFTGTKDSRIGEINSATVTAPTTNSKFPFQYPVGNPTPPAQYTFKKTLQFSPQGECRINSTFDVRRVIEIGLIQTHAAATPTPVSGVGTDAVTFPANTIAIQITGFGSNVKLYRR